MIWIIVNLIMRQIWQVSLFFSSIIISWQFPVPRGQIKWSIRALYHRSQLCNQSFDMKELMILGNGLDISYYFQLCTVVVLNCKWDKIEMLPVINLKSSRCRWLFTWYIWSSHPRIGSGFFKTWVGFEFHKIGVN